MFYAEDRSGGQTGKSASPWAGNLLDLTQLTDWKAEELDLIVNLDVSDEVLLNAGDIYVKRLT
jgi:hypothetical protein